MLEVITKIVSSILTAFYQTFWYSILFAILFMFLYLYAREHGWREAVKSWIQHFKTHSHFRKIFVLAFCVIMILMRTLLNRVMWLNPLSNIWGGWGLTTATGELTTEPIENVLLMIPFTALLMWTFMNKSNKTVGTFLLSGITSGFLFSVIIEILQLFLRVGTVQIADLFYNTLGGAIGGLIYYFCRKLDRNNS